MGTLIHEVCSPEMTFKADLRPVFGSTKSLRQDQPIMVDEFQKMLRRAAIAESFEALVTYCDHSGQSEKLTNLKWYWFAKILRNTVSHHQGDRILWPAKLTKKGISSVSWRHRALDLSMQGSVLHFYDAEILALIQDEIEFIEKSLE